jgi:hypothetical protein
MNFQPLFEKHSLLVAGRTTAAGPTLRLPLAAVRENEVPCRYGGRALVKNFLAE